MAKRIEWEWFLGRTSKLGEQEEERVVSLSDATMTNADIVILYRWAYDSKERCLGMHWASASAGGDLQSSMHDKDGWPSDLDTPDRFRKEFEEFNEQIKR